MLIGDGPADLADGERIEVVVDEDDDAEDRRQDLPTAAGADALHSPIGERLGAAGHEDEGRDHPEENDEQQDVDVPGVEGAVLPEQHREGIPHECERAQGIELGDEQRGDENAGAQADHHFLRDDREDDRHDRRDHRQPRCGFDHGTSSRCAA